MAIDSNSTPRRLPYPLNNPTVIQNEVPATTPAEIQQFAWSTIDDNEVVSIRLDLSLNEYTALAAAVDSGRDLSFDEDSIWIWQIWQKAFRGLSGTMSCDDVADCIETSIVVQDAIIESNDQFGTTNTDYLSPGGTESITIINNRFPPAERALDIHEPPIGCDKDALWAGIRYMVERIDENGRQMLERIVAKVDIWQKVVEFVATVPVVGELAENVLKAFVESVPDLLNAYNAHSSAEVLDDIACDLFEMVCLDCRYPTFQEIADYYASFGITGIQDWADIGLKTVVDYVTGSNGLAGLVVYFTVNTMQMWVLYAQATFVNARKAKTLAIWADIGEDNPTNAWELLCDGCETCESYSYEVDFKVEAGNWVGNGSVTRTDGIGWGWEDLGTFRQSAAYIIFPQNVTIVHVEMTYNRINGNSSGNDSQELRANMNTDHIFPVGDRTEFSASLGNGVQDRCMHPGAGGLPARQLLIALRVNDIGGSQIFLERAKIWVLEEIAGYECVTTTPNSCP